MEIENGEKWNLGEQVITDDKKVKKIYDYYATVSRFQQLIDHQREFQARLKNNIHSIQYWKDMTLALIDEIMESLRETPWKPWKKKQKWNKAELREELIDELHFWINRAIVVFDGEKDIYDAFMAKHKTNNKRQDEGY